MAHWRISLRLLAFLLGLVVVYSGTAGAEGSRNLLIANSYRAFMETGNTVKGDLGTASPPRTTTLFAYANSGETINLGSSAQGLGSAAINVSGPGGAFVCPAPGTSLTGKIGNRTQEKAGPLPNVGGYTPCVYAVTATGIYTIQFLAPMPTGNAAPAADVVDSAGDFLAAGSGDSYIAAWDVSVFSGTTERPGRVWTTYLAMNTGGNGRTSNLLSYVLTKDGYLYKVTADLDPYGFIFFANNKGLKNASGNPSFQSAPVSSATYGSPVAGSDSGTDVTHKVFFNPPASDLPAASGSEWLLTPVPVAPPTPSGLSFVGRDGTTTYAGSSGIYTAGGTFTFSNPGSASYSYRLVIPLSQNGSSTDRILQGTAQAGSTIVNWDGLDGDGKPVPATNTTYTAPVTLLGGEVHFPLLDSEGSSGFNIVRQNGGGNSAAGVLYWDDTPISGSGGTQSSPLRQTAGVDSSVTLRHTWTNPFGDKNAVDTYTYYPSSPVAASSSFTVRAADISVAKSAGGLTSAPRGGAVAYTLTVQNTTANVPGQPLTVTLTDALPGWASAGAWTCASGCTPASGSGAVSTSVTLNGQTPVVINVTDTIKPATASGTILTNTASVTRANDAADLDLTNNTSSVSLPARDAIQNFTLVKTVRNVTKGQASGSIGPVTAAPGDTLEYVVAYSNGGEAPVTSVVIGDAVASNTQVTAASFVCPSGTTVSLTVAQIYSVNLDSACGAGTQVPVGGGGRLVITVKVQ